MKNISNVSLLAIAIMAEMSIFAYIGVLINVGDSRFWVGALWLFSSMLVIALTMKIYDRFG